MITLKGKAFIWGCNLSTASSDATGGIYVLGVGAIVASYNFSSAASKKEILNSIGDCAGVVFSNHKFTLTIEVIISGASSAEAKSHNILPMPGDTVRFVDPDSGDIDGTFSGDFMVDDSSRTGAQDGEVHMTINLSQYTANNLKNTIAA